MDTLPGTGLAANAAASLVQVIFDGGKIRAKTDESKAREEELLAAYRAAVIAAFADVENALGNIQHLSAQEDALKEQVAEDEKVLRAAQRKYLAGYADFLVVTDAERTLYAARDQYSDIRRAHLVATVGLFKALGGGWSAQKRPIISIKSSSLWRGRGRGRQSSTTWAWRSKFPIANCGLFGKPKSLVKRCVGVALAAWMSPKRVPGPRQWPAR